MLRGVEGGSQGLGRQQVGGCVPTMGEDDALVYIAQREVLKYKYKGGFPCRVVGGGFVK